MMRGLGIFCMMVLLIITGGWIFSKLWLWFVIPIFDVSAVSISQSVGLCWLLAYIKGIQSKTEMEWTEVILRVGAHQLTAISIGFIIHWITDKF